MKAEFADFMAENLPNVSENIEDIPKTSNKINAKLKTNKNILISEKHRNSTSQESTKKDKGKLIKDETLNSGSIRFELLLEYFRKIGIKLISFTLSAFVCYHILEIISNFWLSKWASVASNDADTRFKYLRFYAVFGIGQALSHFGASVVFNYGSLKASKLFHDSFLCHILRLPMSFFDTTPLGRILNRYSNDIHTIDKMLPDDVLTLINNVFSMIAIMIAISWAVPKFLFVVIPIYVGFNYIRLYYAATKNQIKRLESAMRSPVYSHLSETIAGRATIKAYKMEERYIFIFQKIY